MPDRGIKGATRLVEGGGEQLGEGSQGWWMEETEGEKWGTEAPEGDEAKEEADESPQQDGGKTFA